MLFYLSDFSDNPKAFLVYFAAFVVAVLTGLAFHEFSHAWTANELGDDTAASPQLHPTVQDTGRQGPRDRPMTAHDTAATRQRGT